MAGTTSKSSSLSDCVLEVHPNDVLFGRGSGPNDHEGNIRFRELVAQRKQEYMATNHRQTKAKIAKDIVNQVFAVNGRFLKKLEGNEVTKMGYQEGQDVYQVVGDDTIMEKAKQALRQNRSRDDGAAGGGASSPVPPHAAMASMSPIFQQTLQQYGNNDVLSAAGVATGVPSAATAAGGAFVGQQEYFQQQQHHHHQQQQQTINPMVAPSNGNVMYQQQSQRPIYSLDNDGYAMYTQTLQDPEDQRYFYTNSATAAGGGSGGGVNRVGGGGRSNYGMPAGHVGGGDGPGGGRTTMMMQSTGNSRRGSALLGGRKADALAGGVGGGGTGGGNRRESLKMDDVWRRDSMGLQGQSMQMSELMESFKGMSTTGELNASTDTIGTIDNFGSLTGANTNAYNLSGISNMSTMSLGSTLSLFKTNSPDTPSSDGKSGQDSGSSNEFHPTATGVGLARSSNPSQSATVTGVGSAPPTDTSFGGSDLWNSRQINSLLHGDMESSANFGGSGVSRASRQVQSLMTAPIESSSSLDVSSSILTMGGREATTSGALLDEHQQQAYPGQILPNEANKG